MMPNRLDAEKRGIGAGRNVDDSHLISGDKNQFDDERRSNSMSVQFAPSDASLRQPGVVYTIQEVLAQVNQKLDEHSKQLQAIWSKLLSIEFEQAALKRELDEMKDGERTQADREDRERQQNMLVVFRFATIIFLFAIMGMLMWLIFHTGAM